MKKVSGILWGIVLVAVGVILTLNAFGVANVDIFFDGWWTLFIIVPCVIGLFTDYDKSGHLIGICIGVFLLLCCQDVLNFDMFWKLLVPAIIVIIGVKMILGSIFDNRGEQVFKQIKENNTTVRSGAATFSGATTRYLPLHTLTSGATGHAVGIKKVANREPLTYYVGAAWSGYDVRTMNQWQAVMDDEEANLREPLRVEVK